MASFRDTVYVLSDVTDLSVNIKKLLPNIRLVEIDFGLIKDNLPEVKKKLQDVEILVCEPRSLAKLLDDSTLSLKYVQSTRAGFDPLIAVYDPKKGNHKFTLARTGTGYGQVMGEYVIGHIIANEKRFKDLHAAQREHKWAKFTLRNNKLEKYTFRQLTNLNIGILGIGQIGTKVAQFCKSLGMTVTGIKRRESKSTSEFIDKYGYLEDLESVLPQCDYICCILPSTPQTRNVLSGTILSCCANKKPVLINIGRGDLINEETIVTAIQNEWLGGAILDVFEEEPLPETSLLWDLPNVTITPHVSGPYQYQQVAECFVENYTRYINGEELKYKVDWDKGY